MVEEISQSGPTWATVVLRGEREGDFLTLEIEYEAPEGDAIGILVRTEYAIASERDRLGDAIENWSDDLFSDGVSASRCSTATSATYGWKPSTDRSQEF